MAHLVVSHPVSEFAGDITRSIVGQQPWLLNDIGLIHHSDHGSQYASYDYQKLLKQHKMICSMSRKGNCWDSAPVERFFSSLKREWTGDRWYRTRQEAIADVREYVAVYYNSRRLHSTLGYTTPMNYEKRLNKVSGICCPLHPALILSRLEGNICLVARNLSNQMTTGVEHMSSKDKSPCS
jgi:transposase InsO family protein